MIEIDDLSKPGSGWLLLALITVGLTLVFTFFAFGWIG